MSMKHMFVIAQLPPPVTGLSLVNERFLERLTQAGVQFDIADISAPTGGSKLPRQLVRSVRVVSAAFGMLRQRVGGVRTLYMPCDGGSGLVFNSLLALQARLLGMRLITHHHSFAYITSKSKLMSLFLALSPRETLHLTLCDKMAGVLRSLYSPTWQSRKHRSTTLSNAFTIAPGTKDRPPRQPGTVVLGHLSNLSVEKGAIAFLDLFKDLRAHGADVRAQLAGGATDPDVKHAIEAVAAEHPGRFEWLGAVYGERKTEFYRNIDLFVFPSVYRNEAQPLVLLEALAEGSPIAATNIGCSGCDHEDSPGWIFSPEGFVENASQAIRSIEDRTTWEQLSEASLSRFKTLKQSSDQVIANIIADEILLSA